jgi:ABC-type nitrate/sulfonate/bicarbonate transport system substrate-binding protein
MKKGRILKPLGVALALVVLLVAFAACGNQESDTGASAAASGSGTDSDANTEAAEGLFTLRAASGSSPDFQIASTLGFFADEGIEIEWVGDTGSGISPFQLLEQGILDVTSSHPPAIAEAKLAGVEITSIAPGAVDNEKMPHVYYLVLNDSDIHSFADLAGKKVGVQDAAVPCMSGFVKFEAGQQGVDFDTIDFVALPEPGQEEQALLDGQIDMTTSHGEAAINALATGEVRLICDTWDIFASEGTGLAPVVVLDSFIEERPDVVQGLVNALYRARLWAIDNTWIKDENGNDTDDWHGAYSALLTDVQADRGIVIEDGFRPVVYTAEKNIPPDWIRQWFDIAEFIGTWEPGAITPEDIYSNDFVPAAAPASDKDITYVSQG